MSINSFLSKFRRITSSSEFIPQIDGLRFVAITAVLFFHFQGKLIKNLVFSDNPNSYFFQRLIVNGDFGVQLFFVISGFILALPFAKYYLGLTDKNVKLKQYFLRRLTRLEPPYFLVILGSFLVYVTVDKTISFITELPHVIAALFYSHNIIYKEFLKVNLVTWSLEIEIQFYILAPFLSMIFKIKPWLRRSLLILLIILIQVLNVYLPLNIRTLYSYLHYFLIGFLLVDFYLQESKFRIPKLISLFLGTVSLIFIFYFNSHETIWIKYLQCILIFIFYYLALKDELWKFAFSNIWLTTIGGMCYTIYLIHFPLEGFIMKSILNFSISSYFIPNFIFQAIIVIPFVLLVSGVFFMLVERPCMKRDWYKNIYIFNRKVKD